MTVWHDDKGQETSGTCWKLLAVFWNDLNLGVDIIQIPSDDELKGICKQSVRNVNFLASRAVFTYKNSNHCLVFCCLKTMRGNTPKHTKAD